jgi:predicted metal-dependent hydrolase
MPESKPLIIEELTFAVRRSARRRTIGITVERDGRLRLALPARCSVRSVEEVVRGKLPWVRRKLAEYEALGPPPAPRTFAGGERLPYRGRWHELRVEAAAPGSGAAVALRRGRFELTLPPQAAEGAARAALVAWYTARTQALLSARVEHFGGIVHVRPSAVRVRDMGKRWGTCESRSRRINFHWETVLLPPRYFDYIVVHELVHLIEPNHGPRFWKRVEDVMPDWRELRRWLRTDGAAYLL